MVARGGAAFSHREIWAVGTVRWLYLTQATTVPGAPSGCPWLPGAVVGAMGNWAVGFEPRRPAWEANGHALTDSPQGEPWSWIRYHVFSECQCATCMFTQALTVTAR